jgi:branched-chain amino acid transport system substrate-binding protein
MRPAGPEKGVGIISAAYVKDPTDPQWQDTPEYKEWLAWMKKYNTAGNLSDIFTVYGYSAAQTMVAVLKQCADNLTRENVMKQAASIHDLKPPMLLPGITVSTSADLVAGVRFFQGVGWLANPFDTPRSCVVGIFRGV